MIFALCTLVGLVLVFCSLLLYRRFLQNKVLMKCQNEAGLNGISSVESVSLGGIPQSILIQSSDVSKPVLLLLHGGPGMPAPGVSFRSVDYAYATTTAELMKHYVLVFWDQRGTGKSYPKGSQCQTMSIEQFISDANELVDDLRARFNQQKIYLAGLSWGTVIALHLASRFPDKFYAYAAMAQIVNWSESDQVCYEWNLNQARKKNNAKAIRELTKMGCPPYLDTKNWLLLRKWNLLQGAFVYQDQRIKAPVLKQYPKTLFSSPDYSLRDILRVFMKTKESYSQQMIEDFAAIDFQTTITKLEIPVYFFHGRHDNAVPGTLAEAYYHRLIAPKGKHFTWLENSAHMFYPGDARMVENSLIELNTQDERIPAPVQSSEAVFSN